MAQPPAIPLTDWLIDYTPSRSLPLDQEAQRIYEHAYQVGLKTEASNEPKISFSTLLIALLVGLDETSRWFATQAPDFGPQPDAVYQEKKLNKPEVDQIARPTTGIPNPLVLSTDRQLLTESARAVIENAEQWAHQVGGSDIGVRHLVASYVLNPPPNHRAQMLRWKFRERSWRRQFFNWVAKRYTAEQWIDASHRPAPTRVVPAFEQAKIKGASLAFPSDANTSAVLERAAEFHSRRQDQDQGLQFRTVLYALVEIASVNNAVRDTILPIWDSIQKARQQYEQSRTDYLPEAKSSDLNLDFSALVISPRVLNALETARELAVATAHDVEGEIRVGSLQFAGALVSRRVDGDEEIASLGLDPQPLRIALIEHAEDGGASGEVWREALGEEETLQTGRPVDLNSDEPEAVVRLDEDWKIDPLAIRPDVEAFAALLASKSLEPPLSIGLFGPWGSGKTTFLRRLHRAVKRRATEAKEAVKNNQPTSYVSNVVHVDFNAWHFAESALTSSLVDTIFRALSAYIKDDQIVAGNEWSKVKREELESTKRKLEAAKAVQQAAQTAVTNAETALNTARAKAAKLTTGLQAAVQGAWSTTKDQLLNLPEVKNSGVLEAVGDTVKSSEDLEAKLNSIRTRPARLLSDLGWARSLLFAALVLAMPLAVGWVIGKAAGYTEQIVSTMTTVLVVIGAWLRTASKAVGKVDEAITRVADAYDERIASDENVVKAQQALDAALVSATTAEASVETAREALAQAQAEAANATLPAQMLQLVSGRIDDQTYNKELTTLSLARADLQALSLLLRDQKTTTPDDNTVPETTETTPTPDTAETAPPPPSPAVRPVDRVILYIDDLDRCKPADVVRVLQLVHMLLAFELFVVVVAVDARWVEEALIDSYKWLANVDDSMPGEASADPVKDETPAQRRATSPVTPQDYLEKIFQISFWLEPMTSARAASYLGSLVRAQAREQSLVAGAGAEAPDGKVEIAGIELDYMRALAAYVGPSPRRVKRLVNAYRLIKARLSTAQLDTFLANRSTEGDVPRSGPYQLVIGLLVIGTGAPTSSAQLLKEIAECDPTESFNELINRFREQNHPDWTMAAKVIETLMRTQRANDVSELRGWARKVGRFLLKGPSSDLAA